MKMRLFVVLLFLPILGQAESLRSLVKTGNAAYRAGEFDEALNAYRQAQAEAPRDALGKFNEGAALYRKDEHDSAAEAFRAAALDAKAAGDSRLEAKSLFNLGNALLKGAEASQKYEPQTSVDQLKQGAAAYRQALGRDPQLTAAAENLQIARARLSELLKQREQQSSKGSNDLESQIQEQLKKQQELSEENRESQQNPSEGEQQQQAQRQKDLQQRSEELSDQTSDNEQVQEELKQAAAEQQKAAQQLSQGQLEEAEESQQQAENHLGQALEHLQQQGKQPSEQQQAQSQPPPTQGQNQSQAQPLQALELTPEDILDQERSARQRRQLLQGQQQRPVEKDW